MDVTGNVTTASCSCETDKPSTRFNSRAEDERMESITFENDLQNAVIYFFYSFLNIGVFRVYLKCCVFKLVYIYHLIVIAMAEP